MWCEKVVSADFQRLSGSAKVLSWNNLFTCDTIVTDPFLDFLPRPSGKDPLTSPSKPRAYRTRAVWRAATITITDRRDRTRIAESLNMPSVGERQ